MQLIIGHATQPGVEGKALPVFLVRADAISRDPLDHLTLPQIHVWTVKRQIMGKTAQPYLQGLGIGLQQHKRVLDEAWPIELPVILTMKDPGGLDVRVGQIDGVQLPQPRYIDEERRMLTPVLGNASLYRLITRVLGDEHLTDRKVIERIEAGKRPFQKVETPATGDHQSDVTVLGKNQDLNLSKTLGSNAPGIHRGQRGILHELLFTASGPSVTLPANEMEVRELPRTIAVIE